MIVSVCLFVCLVALTTVPRSWAVTLTLEVDLPRVRPTDSLAVPELDRTWAGECFVD